MHKCLNIPGLAYCATVVMRALPLADIDFGRLARLGLHHIHDGKAYLAAHAPGLVLVVVYAMLMIWLIASSLATLRLRPGLSVVIAVASLAAMCPPPAAAQSDDPNGIWLTQAGDARVRVSRCGDELCGTVVWLKDKIDPSTGRPFTDDKNPDRALAKRPMIGLPLFLGMRRAGPGKWSGHIYNADDGRTYVSNISITGPSTLKVEGCVGALCGSESWTRWR
jgi:uncharacterized protein (DUF2147 family)